MGIVVDTREGFVDRIKELLSDMPPSQLKDCPSFSFECLGLDLGDYLIRNGTREICIERKSIGDFAATYKHLKKRLDVMRLEYSRVGLLLEGSYNMHDGMIWVFEGNNMHPRMPYRTFSNFITHQQELGTRIYQTMGFDETFYRLIEIHNYLPKLDEPEPASKCGNVSELLVRLPGVGKAKLSDMRSHYNDPLDAINNGLPAKAKDFLSRW